MSQRKMNLPWTSVVTPSLIMKTSLLFQMMMNSSNSSRMTSSSAIMTIAKRPKLTLIICMK